MIKDEDMFPPVLKPIINGMKNKNSIYPKRPMIEIEDFSNLDLETLFFIFYHQKNDYERLAASKELKNR